MYVAGVAAARERHVTHMPSFDNKLETRLGGRSSGHRAQEGLVCFYRTRGERIEDRVYIVCWLDFPVYQSDTLLQEKHPWILVSVRNIDIY